MFDGREFLDSDEQVGGKQRPAIPKAGWHGPSAVDAFVDGSGPRGAPVVPSLFHHLRVGIERLRRVGRDLVSIKRNSATR
jgi:hypothetical protein